MPRVLTATLPSLIWWLGLLTALRALYLFFVPLPLSGDEAQYWVWAQSLDWGYYSKPPLLAWMIALTTSIGGDSEPWVRLFSPLAHGVTALFLGLTALRLRDEQTGFWVGIGYAALPAVFFSSLLISTDVPLLLFLSVWLYCCVRASDSPRWLIAAGFALGLAALSKYAALFLLPAYLAHGHSLKQYRMVGLGLVVMLLCLAPNLWWNAQHGFITFAHTEANIQGGGFRLNPLDALAFIGEQAGVIGALFLLLFAVVLKPRRLDFGQNTALLWLSLLPLLLITGQALLSRANANWGVSAYIGGMVLIGVAASMRGWLPWLRRAVFFNATLGALLLTLPWLAAELPLKKDPLRKIRGYEQLTAAFLEKRAAECPECAVVTRDRMPTAWLRYYGRDALKSENVFIFDPNQKPTNHFSLCCRFDEKTPTPLLYFARAGEPLLFSQFRVVEPRGEITVMPRPDQRLTFTVVYLDGYKGHD